MLRNGIEPIVFDDLQSRKMPSTFTDKPNGSLILLESIRKNYFKSINKQQVL